MAREKRHTEIGLADVTGIVDGETGGSVRHIAKPPERDEVAGSTSGVRSEW